MQALGINKQRIWYAQQSGHTEIMQDGYKTGNKAKTYTEPVKVWMNVSPQRGNAEFEPFGVNLDYDRTIVTADMNCPINEHTVLWIGTTPDQPFNYVVRKVARSINSITYAIKEVTAS